MRLIQEWVALSVDSGSGIRVTHSSGALLLLWVQNHMTQIFNVLKLLFSKELDDFVNKFFLNPNEEDAVTHHSLWNFEFFKFVNRDSAR